MSPRPILLALLLFAAAARAEEAHRTLEAERRQAWMDLRTDLRVLCVAAHPDDEDGATLAWCRRTLGCATYVLLATRGEGGQNEIGSELGPELAAIRTVEMEEAAAVTGSRVFHLNRPEFGYSRSSDETFRVWGRDETLRLLVEMLRRLRPHVVITNHNTTEGHGHHRAIGVLLPEAVGAAADPARFPGTPPWKVERLFVRCQRRDATVTVPIGDLDPFYGLSYAQIAHHALRKHRSQGRWGAGPGGGPLVRHYRLMGGGKVPGLVEGLPLLEAPAEAAEWAAAGAAAREPADLARLLGQAPPGPYAEERRERLMRALQTSLGLRLEAIPATRRLAPGDRVSLRLRLRAPETLEPPALDLTAVPGLEVTRAATGPGVFVVEAGENAPRTLPATRLLALDTAPPPLLEARARVRALGVELTVRSPVACEVGEALEARLPGVFPFLLRSGGWEGGRVPILLEARSQALREARVRLLADGAPVGEEQVVAFTRSRRTRTCELPIPPKARALTVVTRWADGSTETRVPVLDLDVRVGRGSSLRVGLVRTYDDTLADALRLLGVRFDLLTPDEVQRGDLSVYSTILLDIRAWLARDDVRAASDRLLRFVHDGGHLVAMYNKTGEWSPEFAPYPFRITERRVTEEDAPITILKPDHPLLSRPNRIGPADFEGWVQERGLYFPDRYGAEYEELLACGDRGTRLLRGGILAARYGRGTWTYTSLAWYRQLRAAVPGAFRFLANAASRSRG